MDGVFCAPAGVGVVGAGWRGGVFAGPAVGVALAGAVGLGAVDVAVHPTTGDIYFCEVGNKRVRRVARATGAVASIPSTFLPGATDPGVTNNSNNAYTGLTFDTQGRCRLVAKSV